MCFYAVQIKCIVSDHLTFLKMNYMAILNISLLFC